MADNLKDLLQIKNSTEEAFDIYMYGDIVSKWYGKWSEEDKYPMEVKELLDKAGSRDINLHINSGGGSVFAGMAIYNMLVNYSGAVTTYIDGLAASIASVIALAGDRIIMRTGSSMMIHKPMLILIGGYNANDLSKMAGDLDEIQKCIMQVYEKRKSEGADIAEIEEKVNNETWMSSDEATLLFDIETDGEEEAVASIKSDFIAKYTNGIPPQYAQEKPENKSEEYIASEKARDKALAEIEILKLN